MIPKGLKVGDTFEQCGALFEVTEVVGENYFCKRVGATPPLAKVEQPKEEKKSVDYESMAYSELKKLCAKMNIDARGTKADLIARLEG